MTSPLSHVLVIDDDSAIARGMARMLHGYDVEIETDPQRALDRVLSNEHFDVIVCDQQMPALDGHEVRAAIDAHFAGRSDAPCVIMMSGGLDFIGSMDHASILHKPFRCAELRELVGLLLAQRERHAA